MSERKILLFIVSVIFYCLYSVHMWFMTNNVNDEKPINHNTNVDSKPEVKQSHFNTSIVKRKPIPSFFKDACSVLEVFTKKPQVTKIKRSKIKDMDPENNTITSIGITVFLVILVLNALFDVLKVKEEERARRKLNPNEERRQSLAEFANKKTLRRESSKFGLQLFQIAETEPSPTEEKKSSSIVRPFVRPENENTASTFIKDPPEDTKITKSESITKLIGANPAPMIRRSSYPALPLNPEIHNLMKSRQYSFNEESSEKKRRPARIIRRF